MNITLHLKFDNKTRRQCYFIWLFFSLFTLNFAPYGIESRDIFTFGPTTASGGGGAEPESDSAASQYPRSISPSSEVNPREPSIEGQQWCSMIRIALQQPGPRYVSPFRKNRMTSPVQDCSWNNESQQPLPVSWSSFSRAMRVCFGFESSGRDAAMEKARKHDMRSVGRMFWW